MPYLNSSRSYIKKKPLEVGIEDSLVKGCFKTSLNDNFLSWLRISSMPLKTFPPVTRFPLQINALDRKRLEDSYMDLRDNYKRLKISRGLHLYHSKKKTVSIQNYDAVQAAKGDIAARVRAIVEREASIRAEAYEILEIVTDVFAKLEDAGDELSLGVEEYEKGRRTMQGGRSLANLIKAVYNFVRNWLSIKTQIKAITEKQDSIKDKLESGDGRVN